MKKRIRFLCKQFFYLTTFLPVLCGVVIADPPPNILVIVTDDQNPNTIRALGNNSIHTPNIDRLVETGTSFQRAYASFPLCVPTRVEILTGATGFRNGIFPPFSRDINRDLTTWPQVLAEVGYNTWYVGKWHTSGRPSEYGYSKTRGLFSSGGSDHPLTEPVDAHGFEVTGYRGWVFQTDDRQIQPEKGIGLTPGIDALFADAAIELIDRQSEQPFFMHVNFTGPHDPLHWPPGFENKYDPDDIPLPPNFKPEHPFDHGHLDRRDEVLLPFPRTPDMIRQDLAIYYSVISFIDAQIGRIIEALETTGQLENTIIIFTSDHGLAMGSHGLRGKQNMYEHSVRVPLIFKGPGIPEGRISNALANLRDLFPTTSEIAGATVPDTVDGYSLLPLIKGETDGVRDRIFGYFESEMRMIQTHRWKLIHYPQAERYQLFDLYEDPDELNDLAFNPAHSDRVAQLSNELLSWQQEMNDPILK